MAPPEYTAATNIRSGPVKTNVAQHHSDVLLSSSTEGSRDGSEDAQSDEFKTGGQAETGQFDHISLAGLKVPVQPWTVFPTSGAPRAPPASSL